MYYANSCLKWKRKSKNEKYEQESQLDPSVRRPSGRFLKCDVMKVLVYDHKSIKYSDWMNERTNEINNMSYA